MSTLELREVVKHYSTGIETIKAVDGVSLTVSGGEFVALYGPSGSGKTTLLMLAAALSTPDSGSISFDGRLLSELSERDSALYRRRDVGFVFQAFHLMPHTSALDNATIKLTGDGCTLREGRRRALPWLERVGLASRADYTPEQLSMGERQRIAIARALANEPRLLLADEPTGNLDSKRSREILALMRDICHERGIPGLLVTHDLDAAPFADRVHTLRDGHMAGWNRSGAGSELIVKGALNPSIAGVRVSMLAHLYRVRLRSHAVQELLAGSGIAVGVALVLGVLVANASLTGSAGGLVQELVGSARLQLVARSQNGFEQKLATSSADLPGVKVAAPILRENIAVVGPQGRRESVQLLGVSAAATRLGGLDTRELGLGGFQFSGGLILPEAVANAVGVGQGGRVTVLAFGSAHTIAVAAVLKSSLFGVVASSPVAVTVLGRAQRLAGVGERVTQVLIEPRPGAEHLVASELRTLAAGRLGVTPADDELSLLAQAVKPNDQSTSLFAAISVMVGFLLALNAMLLTVPERRRFVADLRLQGYDWRQVIVLLVFQAGVLGVAASIVGVGLGDALSHVFLHRIPEYLTTAFPIGTEDTLHMSAVLVAVGCGVLAALLASLSPALDLRPGRPTDAVFRDRSARGEVLARTTPLKLSVIGAALLAAITAAVLLAPGLTIVGGMALAVAALFAIPSLFAAIGRVLRWIGERVPSSSLIVVVSELRAVTTRTVALAGIAALALYGSVAIGGARADLIHGLDASFSEYLGTADLWVTTGGNDLTTNSFRAEGAVQAVARSAGVASVRVYQGAYLDVGKRRMWIIARPATDSVMIPASQLVQGSFAYATQLLRAGGWATVSAAFAQEHHLGVGSTFALPTPSGTAYLRVAAVTTNLGWSPGAIILNTAEYSRWWQTSEPSALEVNLEPGVSQAAGKRTVARALAGRPGLGVQTLDARRRQYDSNAQQGLSALSEISALLLIAAALAVAAALSASVWQRRPRLASLKIQGYDTGQLWRALLLESAIVLGIGCVVGALAGVYGHALASRWLRLETGFPAPFQVGIGRVLLTLALMAAIALTVMALPGLAAARAPARESLQE